MNSETRILSSRPRPRLSFWVSWNRDRDRDFKFESRGIETETETFILGLIKIHRDQDLYVESSEIDPETESFISVSWNQRQSQKHKVKITDK